MKANRLSIKKKDLKMNHKDALLAEERKNSKETVAVIAAADMAAKATEEAGNKRIKKM